MQLSRITILTSTLLVGCGVNRTGIAPLENGYGHTAYYSGFIHREVRGELQYQSPNEKPKIIWHENIAHVINGDMIVFTGMLRSEAGFRGDHLFVYQPPGPVVDITDQVLELNAKEHGANSPRATATPATLEKTIDGVAVGIAFTEGNNTAILKWGQISDLIRVAKEKGILRKNLLGGTPYLEMEFDPAARK